MNGLTIGQRRRLLGVVIFTSYPWKHGSSAKTLYCQRGNVARGGMCVSWIQIMLRLVHSAVKPLSTPRLPIRQNASGKARKRVLRLCVTDCIKGADDKIRIILSCLRQDLFDLAALRRICAGLICCAGESGVQVKEALSSATPPQKDPGEKNNVATWVGTNGKNLLRWSTVCPLLGKCSHAALLTDAIPGLVEC